MENDPLANFGEQQRSHELLDQFGPEFVAEALEILAEAPEAQLVGLVICAEAAEATALLGGLEAVTGQDLAGRGVRGIFARNFVLEILRANAPASLDWLPPMEMDGRRMLPMAVFTQGGVRFGARPLP